MSKRQPPAAAPSLISATRFRDGLLEREGPFLPVQEPEGHPGDEAQVLELEGSRDARSGESLLIENELQQALASL